MVKITNGVRGRGRERRGGGLGLVLLWVGRWWYSFLSPSASRSHFLRGCMGRTTPPNKSLQKIHEMDIYRFGCIPRLLCRITASLGHTHHAHCVDVSLESLEDGCTLYSASTEAAPRRGSVCVPLSDPRGPSHIPCLVYRDGVAALKDIAFC
jgi:hypothetical protein